MGAFLSGLVQGGADEYTKLKAPQGSSGGAGSSSSSTPKTSKLQGAIPKIISKWRNKNKVQPTGDSPVSQSDQSSPASAKRGARNVRKTGLMRVHKGEAVLRKSVAKRYRRATGRKRSSRRSGGDRR